MFPVLLTMVLLLTRLDAYVPPANMAANQVNYNFYISGSTIGGRKLIFTGAVADQNAAPLLLGTLEKTYVRPSAPNPFIPSFPGTIGSEHDIGGETSVNSLKTAPNGGPPTSPTLAPASTNNQRIKRDMPAGADMAANQVNYDVHISGSTIGGRKLIFTGAGADQNAAPLLLGTLEKTFVRPSAPNPFIPSFHGTIGSEHAIGGDTSVNSLKTAPNGGPPTSPTLASASTNNQRIKRDMPAGAGNVVAPTPSIAYP